MPSNHPLQRFEDILFNIARIQTHIYSVPDENAFEENALVYDAVERCLQRISEAATKLGPAAEVACPGIPWRNIRGLGNILRHEYDLVQSVRLWYVIIDDLPPLKAAVEAAVSSIKDGEQ